MLDILPQAFAAAGNPPSSQNHEVPGAPIPQIDVIEH
jgi:hypothetical protein